MHALACHGSSHIASGFVAAFTQEFLSPMAIA